jgi:CheY-like chemotaxis protein
MRVLILEDRGERVAQFMENMMDHLVVVVNDSKECIRLLGAGDATWDVLFLDHDLGGQIMVKSGENTGQEVTEWLKDRPDCKPETVILHSANPDGVKAMKFDIPDALVVPFAWTKQLS